MKKPPLNKWQLIIGLAANYWELNGYTIALGLIKVTKYPDKGEALGKENYRGFLLHKEFHLPRGFFLQLPSYEPEAQQTPQPSEADTANK